LQYSHPQKIDRKFADIGATVKAQYAGGMYHIASWSHITNAHSLPGDGIVKGLKEAGQPLGRGLLLLAEMSSAGSLATRDYAQETLKMAIQHSDFVFGFIGQRRLSLPTSSFEMPDFIYMTPGVQLPPEGESSENSSGKKTGGDSLGQQYRSPRDVIFHARCDVIIVGRGILGVAAKEGYSESTKVLQDRARAYQKAGWDAYLERIQ
jgi:orotidine-5'-phosphate decarboxylase